MAPSTWLPGEFGQHARRHRGGRRDPARGWCAAGRWPHTARASASRRAVGPGEADRGQQQRLTRVGQQLDNGLAARNGGCQAQVEQRGAARDVDARDHAGRCTRSVRAGSACSSIVSAARRIRNRQG